MRALFGPALGTLALSLVPAPNGAWAAWPTDPTVNLPVCTAERSQDSPRIVPDTAGGAIVAWLDARTNQDHVYAQRIDASGDPLWTPDGVAVCAGAGVRGALTMVADGAGGAILAWHELRGGFDIYAQRVNPDGTLAWPAGGAPVCTAGGDQFQPVLSEDGFGGALLGWIDNRLVTSKAFAQHIDATGAPLWTLDGVKISEAPGAQLPWAIRADGFGGAFVAWQDGRAPDIQINGNYDVYAQRLDAAGALQWDLLGAPVCTALFFQAFVRIAPDGEGGILLSWHDRRNDGSDVYAQRMSGEGTPVWAQNGIPICTEEDWQTFPEIVSDGAGGAIITWQDFRTLSHYDIYAQRTSGEGVVMWTTNGVALCTAAGWQTGPEITSDLAGGAIVAWEDQRADSSDIYVQRIGHDGGVLWSDDGVATCSAPRNQHAPVVATNGTSGAIVAWFDFRPGGTTDIYAQGVNADGSLGQVVGVGPGARADLPPLVAMSPNPAAGNVRIAFELQRPTALDLSIFDALGRRVVLLASGTREVGRHEVTWNGRDALGRASPGGAYFARLMTGTGVISQRIVRLP